MVRLLAALNLLVLVGAPAAARANRVLLVDASAASVDEAVRRTALQAFGAALQRELGWHPQEPADPEAQLKQKLQPLLASARAHSEAFRERRALAVLEDAEAVYRAAVGPVISIEPLRELLLFQAKLLSDLGEREELRDLLGRLEALAPGRSLDPAGFPPAVVRLQRTLQRELGQGELRVSSTPLGLTVWIDGVLRGQAPLVLQLTAGEHFVVMGAGGQRVGQAVTVSRDTEQSVALRLPDPRAAWRAAARQAGASGVMALSVVPLRGGLQLRVSFQPEGGPDQQLASARVSAGTLRLAAEELATRLRPARRSGGRVRVGVRARRSPAPAARPWWRAWWLWTTVAVVVGGAAIGTGVALTRDRSARIHLSLER